MRQIRSRLSSAAKILLAVFVTACRPQADFTLQPGRQFLPPATDACQFATTTGAVIEIYSSQQIEAADAGSESRCGTFDVLALPGGPGGSIENPDYYQLQEALPELRIGFVNPLGLGGSSPLPATGSALEQQLVSLEEVIDATLDGPRLLLGTSWGANAAALLAARDGTQPYLALLESPGYLLLQPAPHSACRAGQAAAALSRPVECLELEARFGRALQRGINRVLRNISRQFELAGPDDALSFLRERPLFDGTLDVSVNMRIMQEFRHIRLAPTPHPATRFAVLRGAKDRIKQSDITGYGQIAPVITVWTLEDQGHSLERDDCPYVNALRDVIGLLDPRVQKRSCSTFLDPVPGMEGGFVRRIQLGPPPTGPVE
jgi:pimeloyl-ACP methyl ester carboxylesterase